MFACSSADDGTCAFHDVSGVHHDVVDGGGGDGVVAVTHCIQATVLISLMHVFRSCYIFGFEVSANVII